MIPQQILAMITPALQQLPAHLQPALKRYFVDRQRPGRFLQAVLRNDLAGALLRADPVGAEALRDLALFLHKHAPQGSHGSEEAVENWLAGAPAEAGK